MFRVVCLFVVMVIAVSGCSRSNDFTATPEMSGEEIFKLACMECHSPKLGYVMMLDEDMNDVDLIANQVLTGSMSMPAFPNLQGEPARKLAEYIIANSKVRD